MLENSEKDHMQHNFKPLIKNNSGFFNESWVRIILAVSIVTDLAIFNDTATATAQTPRNLLILPVQDRVPLDTATLRMAMMIQQASQTKDIAILPLIRSASIFENKVFPQVSGQIDEKRLRVLDSAIEIGKESFIMNRYDAAVEKLEQVLDESRPVLSKAGRIWPDFHFRFFHGMMILGRSYDAVGNIEKAQQIYGWLVRAFPEMTVDETRYPPSLLRRYAELRAQAAARVATLLVRGDGQAPVDPDGCDVILDGTVRGRLGTAIPGIPYGDYRCAVACREGLASRDYHLQVAAPRVEMTAFLGDDAAIFTSEKILVQSLAPPWQEKDYLGPAWAAGRILEAPLVLLCGPARTAGGVEIILSDVYRRILLERRVVPAADLPNSPEAGAALLNLLLISAEQKQRAPGEAEEFKQTTPRSWSKTASWSASGLALIGGVSGLVFFLQSSSNTEQYDTCAKCSPERRAEFEDQASLYRDLGYLSFGVAGAASIAAIVFHLLDPGPTTGTDTGLAHSERPFTIRPWWLTDRQAAGAHFTFPF